MSSKIRYIFEDEKVLRVVIHNIGSHFISFEIGMDVLFGKSSAQTSEASEIQLDLSEP